MLMAKMKTTQPDQCFILFFYYFFTHRVYSLANGNDLILFTLTFEKYPDKISQRPVSSSQNIAEPDRENRGLRR